MLVSVPQHEDIVMARIAEKDYEIVHVGGDKRPPLTTTLSGRDQLNLELRGLYLLAGRSR